VTAPDPLVAEVDYKAVAGRVDPLGVQVRLAFAAALAERLLEAIGDRLPADARDVTWTNPRTLWDVAEGRADPASLVEAADRQTDVNERVFSEDEDQPGFNAALVVETAMFAGERGVGDVAEGFQRYVSDPYHRRWTRAQMEPGKATVLLPLSSDEEFEHDAARVPEIRREWEYLAAVTVWAERQGETVTRASLPRADPPEWQLS
jgi:hypothetical protein